MTEYQDNRQKFLKLREDFPTFCYDDFKTQMTDKGVEIQFFFSCGEYCFTPIQIFENKDFYKNTLSKQQLDVLAFNLGLIELVSYWKAFCSPTIKIKCGKLTDKQQDFWKKLYRNGLGEFLYLNGLKDYNGELFSFECIGEYYQKQIFEVKEEYLVPIGGGKDSVCSLELLRGKGKDITPLIINSRGATKDCIEKGGFSLNECFTIKRTIDKTLLDLNAKGFLNGHTPFSAMLAFSSLIVSALTRKKYIALSNENSANEGTVKGYEINHQYSKSLEFENDFRAYYKEFLGEEFEYFSLLRPISELRIAEIFSFLNYKDVFKSCNVGSKQDIWCGHCPKCLFAYIILSPFVDKTELNNIFGKDMLDESSLIKEFNELIGATELKPFECVGTIEEVNVALSMRYSKYQNEQQPYLLNYWTTTDVGKQYLNKNFSPLLQKEYPENNLPKDLQDIFKNPYIITKKAELSLKLRNKRIAILGLGREGKSTYHLIKELFPTIPLILFDKNKNAFLDLNISNDVCYSSEEDYKTINENSDIIFLTPGIAMKDLHDIDKEKVTNQCDCFLQVFHNQAIGITGTKGKSTTTSLIYQIIKDQTPNVILAGNIGIPVFDILEQINQDTLLVLELSCHQLEHIKRSPSISVLLNLYEEHLDHYTSYQDYKNAKLNLFKCRQNKDVFIYNKEDKETHLELQKLTSDKYVQGFGIEDYVFQEPLYLKGSHNKLNIVAALKVVENLQNFSKQQAIDSALKFKGLEHRLQFVTNLNGVDYYNDSISTIPQATIAALKSLGNVSTLILGGMDRGINYTPLATIVEDFKVKHIAFVGKAGERMFKIIKDKSSDFDYLLSNDWNEITTWVKQKAERGTSVLLSPAASSYDQFKNFEYRGKAFVELIKE